ncbi:Acetylornithine deacetylase [Tenacibaculum sp. 190130A14a]|uniref:Acetylornithine deacetylase n=1 Tax=Tenacibaculum polynesiense TaxID=3137857 RepID=A0ABM9PBM7_9FLAO
MISKLTTKAISLLKDLIATPSFSSEEAHTAQLLENWFQNFDIPYIRTQNNVWSVNKAYDPKKPTILLNSHHDTVKPNNGYTKDPFYPIVEDGKLYGLGSNDAGGCLVSLLATYTYFYEQQNLTYNLVFAGTAEEESSGPNGLNGLLKELPTIDVAIVGEPTLMQLAIAEKGLVVFDAEVIGTPSHAAHQNNDNAIYNTVKVLEWFQKLRFEKSSETLGDVKVTVTQINAGKQHNAVPASVSMVVDIRVNDQYTNEEINDYLQKHAPCTNITPRSLYLNSSSISKEHPLVQAGIELGRKTYGSPTLSDQSILNCPSLKLGPGDSKRSHTADEFIYLQEIEEGIDLYIQLLEKVVRS